MKTVILAGGLGTRLAEETGVKPKPMVEIGGQPILWHVMKHYSEHGFNEFVVALGYKGEMIKRYFLDYYPLFGDLTIDLCDRRSHRRQQRVRTVGRPPRRHGRRKHDRRQGVAAA